MKIQIPENENKKTLNPQPGLIIGISGKYIGEVLLRLSRNSSIREGDNVVVLRAAEEHKELKVPYLATRILLHDTDFYAPFNGDISLGND